MNTSWPLMKMLYGLSEESYDRTLSAYRFWIKLGAARGSVSNHQLYSDILRGAHTNRNLMVAPRREGYNIQYNNTAQKATSGQVIHRNAHLLIRFITNAELDPVLSTYAIGLHDRLYRESLEKFFGQGLDYIPGGPEEPTSVQLCEFYTRTNLIAHWVNLGYAKLEDVRDHILQSLILQPTVYPHHLNSLMILLKISGATFAAYADPSVMDHCCDLLKPSNLSYQLVLFELAEVRAPILTARISYERCGLQEVLRLRESGWEGLPAPPILRSAQPETTVPESQDPAVTPVATSLGLPSIGEQSQPPTLPSPAPDIPSGWSPRSSAPPSPSTSITALSDFTIADSLDDEPIPEPETTTLHEPTLEPETISPHDAFYLDDGSVEVLCGKTLFRVHTSALSFHSPVLRQMFSPTNLTAAESPNGCPRIVSSDTPTDFATLLKVIYLPE